MIRAGVRIEHEHIRGHGMASWYAAAGEYDMRTPAWFRKMGKSGGRREKLSDFKIKPVILHQVRHPLKAISTFQRAAPSSWKFIVSVFEKAGIAFSSSWPKPKMCMVYWLHWSRLAERIAEWRYRIEDLGNVWDEWCNRLGHPELIERKEELLSKKWQGYRRNSQPETYTPLRWRQLRKIDGDITAQVIEQGRRYGYKI